MYIGLSCLLALALADERSHQSIQHGHAPPHGHEIIKGHHDMHAIVHQQPHTAPQDVHNPYHGKEKYHASAIHPAHGPTYKAPIVYKPIPPVVYRPIPKPAPKIIYKPAPAPHYPAPAAYPAYPDVCNLSVLTLK